MDRTRLSLSVLVLLALAFALVGGGGIGSPPPFATDKLAVLVIEETTERGKYTADQRNVIASTDANSVRGKVKAKGGEFHLIDESIAADKLALSPAWVQAAFKVKREGRPWIVGATPRRGFSMPLASEAEVLAKVEGL